MELSIVVVSRSRPEILEECLQALLAQASAVGAEVLLVRRPTGDPAVSALVARHPEVTWLEAAPGDTVPRLRAAGLRRAQGRVVALLEDDCVIADGWCRTVLAAHQGDRVAVGGPIEPDLYRRGLDWGVFFCEYARFLPPFEGEKAALPGNNVSYRRALVLAWLEGRGEGGFLEVFAHQEWRAQGIPLIADGGMRVRNVNRWTRDSVTWSAFHHGRAFAGQRFQEAGYRALPGRLLFAAGSPLLPVLKTARVVREVLRRGRGAGSLPPALPWIILFEASWAFGEFLGYLLGAGRSADRWQ